MSSAAGSTSRKPFRALVAGGGTGDAAIMLAQQLADAGAAQAEIVYLDWSKASRAVAEARAKARGLSTIRFVTGSLLDLPTLGASGRSTTSIAAACCITSTIRRRGLRCSRARWRRTAAWG